MTAPAAGRPGASPRAVIRRLVRLSPPPWRRLVLATAFGVAAALATVGLLAASGAVVGRASLRPGLGAIAGLLALVEVLAIIRAPLRYGERLVAHDAAFSALTRWRVWLYNRLEPLAPAGLAGWRSGDLLSRAIEDVDALQDLYLRGLIPVIVAVCSAGLAVVIVGLLLPAAALVLGLCLIAALVLPPLVASRARTLEGRGAALRSALADDIVDLVQGAPELVAFGGDGDLLARIEDTDRALTELARRRAVVAGAASALITVLIGGAVVGVLAVAVDAVAGHRLSAVMLAVLPLAALGAFEAVPGVTVAALRLGDVVAAGRRLLAIEEVPIPVTDPGRPVALPAGCPEVELVDARLRFRPDLPWALDGLTLHLAPGTHLAVVGASGAGKSSVVNTLLRFWPLESGSLTLGGVAIEDLAQRDVRAALGLMAQDTQLFAGSIGHNITLGRPDASDQEVRDVVALAQLDSWVATLPEGLDTPVGERGQQVSGGQRQRIALARVLLTGCQVLVLDEPTAGLDEPAASRLLADVRAAMAGRSLLLVTHRDEDLAGFDRVVTVEDGRVVERA